MEISGALRREYRLRINVKGRKSLVVAFPYEVVEREAREKHLSIEEFLEKYKAVAQFDGFTGVHYCFEEISSGSKK